MTNQQHVIVVQQSESTRQQDVAAAIKAGGGAGVVAAAVKAADVAHYGRVIASAQANNGGSGIQTALDALRSLQGQR